MLNDSVICPTGGREQQRITNYRKFLLAQNHHWILLHHMSGGTQQVFQNVPHDPSKTLQRPFMFWQIFFFFFWIPVITIRVLSVFAGKMWLKKSVLVLTMIHDVCLFFLNKSFYSLLQTIYSFAGINVFFPSPSVSCTWDAHYFSSCHSLHLSLSGFVKSHVREWHGSSLSTIQTNFLEYIKRHTNMVTMVT